LCKRKLEKEKKKTEKQKPRKTHLRKGIRKHTQKQLEMLLNPRGQEWCLCQAYKCYFGFV